MRCLLEQLRPGRDRLVDQNRVIRHITYPSVLKWVFGFVRPWTHPDEGEVSEQLPPRSRATANGCRVERYRQPRIVLRTDTRKAACSLVWPIGCQVVACRLTRSSKPEESRMFVKPQLLAEQCVLGEQLRAASHRVSCNSGRRRCSRARRLHQTLHGMPAGTSPTDAGVPYGGDQVGEQGGLLSPRGMEGGSHRLAGGRSKWVRPRRVGVFSDRGS